MKAQRNTGRKRGALGAAPRLEMSDVRWEYEDQLPEMGDADFDAIFKASLVDGVRLYPYVEDSTGKRTWITNLPEEVHVICRKTRSGKKRKPVGGVTTVDELIKQLESRGLGWSLDNTGRNIEARVWDWPHVIGRYRPTSAEPLAKMLAESMSQVDWARYPVKRTADKTK